MRTESRTRFLIPLQHREAHRSLPVLPRFFVLADGRIVIVDPDDLRIVYILTA